MRCLTRVGVVVLCLLWTMPAWAQAGAEEPAAEGARISGVEAGADETHAGEEEPAAAAAAEDEGVASAVAAGEPEEAPALPQRTGDVLWLLIASVLVFFMQAGFALLECGLTRAKNAVNIMTKNLMDFCFGALIFWAIGYAFMYGEGGNRFIGWDSNYFLMRAMNVGQDNWESVSWFFQIVFAATAATIVSGALAERTRLVGYVAYSVLITALLYPVTGHWIWGGNGWLGGMGMRDFAGSTVVHSVGAWAALAGVLMIGPRLGKYNKDGTPNPIPGHNIPMAALGTFILWFGWYGFNPGSTLAAVDGIAHVAVTTTLAAAAGAVAGLLTSWTRTGKPDLTMGLNGCLAGLVGITAPCASVSGSSAVLIGLIAGVLVYFSAVFFERTLKVDDPVGAISVHGVCGVWGTLAVGLFGQRAIDIRYWDADTAIRDGLLFGGGLGQLFIQLVGVLAVFAYTFLLALAVFAVIKATVGLRVSPEEELQGLDLGEHGEEAYPNFAITERGGFASLAGAPASPPVISPASGALLRERTHPSDA